MSKYVKILYYLLVICHIIYHINNLYIFGHLNNLINVLINRIVSPFFSPSGKLVQIEYALAAVAAGAPSVGIKALNGVVLATENKHKSILYDEHSVSKVEMITKHIGMVYSGMGPDYRLLVKQARKMAQQYLLVYREPIPTAQLVQRVAMVMQEYTQSG